MLPTGVVNKDESSFWRFKKAEQKQDICFSRPTQAAFLQEDFSLLFCYN